MRRLEKRSVRRKWRRGAYSTEMTGVVFTKSWWSIPILPKRQVQVFITSLMAKWRMRLSTSRKPSSQGEPAPRLQDVSTWWLPRSSETKSQTMESIKCGIAIGDKTLYGMTTLFCVLITVGQHRKVELQTLLDYIVPASIIGEYGCLRKGGKSTLVSKLKVYRLQPDSPDIMIVDG